MHNILHQTEEHRIEPEIFGILVHDGWNPNEKRFTHDIALIKLKEEIKFNKFIRPICLMNDDISGIKRGIVAGYGKFNESEIASSDVPLKVELPILNNLVDCVIRDDKLATIVWHESFCAGRDDAGVCSGDSGSGFYMEYNRKFYLRGIVSAAVHSGLCNCTYNNYALYSDVQKYMKTFIEPVRYINRLFNRNI